MKKLLSVALCVALSALCAWASAEVRTGAARGFGGEVKVNVTVEGGAITAVAAIGESETNGIGSRAIAELPAAIVQAGSADVDGVSGATVTSAAIVRAVKNALDPEAFPYEAEAKAAEEVQALLKAEASLGFGVVSSGRIGPGKDDTDAQVYSINQVMASAIFDGEGRVLRAYIDQVEVATPNYDGDSMPHFSGFPGQTAYNNDADHDEKIDSVIEPSEETFLSEIASWTTKRERGDGYRMATGSWSSEMNAYEQLFQGKTVDEIKAWYLSYCSDINGRPLKADSANEADQAKYAALNDAAKQMLADVVSSATISLNDSHGDIVGAIEKAYANRRPLAQLRATSMGQAVLPSGRVGPGKDDTDTQVYSINEVHVTALFDEEGRVAALTIDETETATPNYDGASMPHFTGYPGHGGYNNDENHDEKVDGTLEPTDESFLGEISGWTTKRERGEDYRLTTASWASEIDRYEKLFTGKTVEEIKAWYASYCSDVNGRPLKADSINEADQAKYAGLNEEEKAMLADVVSSATISLNDSHGNIVGAIEKAYANRFPIDLTVG